MPHTTPPPPCDHGNANCIAVVGGGISGLAAAYRLVELFPGVPVKLFEASSRLGGVLRTVREGDYLLEASADNFINKLPWAESLCQRVGLAGDLLATEPSLRRAMVVRNGNVTPVPEGFLLMSARRLGPVLRSPLLSWRGKLRLSLEPFVGARREAADESVASFARRRLGDEVFQRIVQPLVAGIYTADPEKLSMQATMPQFLDREQQFGSLWRARKTGGNTGDGGAQYSAFFAPRLGMSQLVDAVAARLPAGTIQLSTPVAGISKQPGSSGWQLQLADGTTVSAMAVIVAVPAHRAAEHLTEVDPELSDLIAGIEHASSSVVALGVRRDQVQKPIEGFGFVVPQAENRQIIAASFASLKFPGRAAEDRLLVRVFIGGALQPELAELSDDRLLAIAGRELGELIGMRGEPELSQVFRWPQVMPQYHVGHLQRVERIESRLAQLPGVELAGNAYRGVGIPQCIRSGELAAERAADFLKKSQS